jgi:HAMP domain-containing protein
MRLALGNKKRNKPYYPNSRGGSQKSRRKEAYLQKMLSSESEGNTNDFPRDPKEDYGEVIEASGRGVSTGVDDRHRILPPANETQQNPKSFSNGSVLTIIGISVTIVLAIIAGVYKFGNLEGRVQENINKLTDTNKSLSDLGNKIAMISERIAKMEERGKYSEEISDSAKNMKKQVDELEKQLHLVEKQSSENERIIQSMNSQINKIEASIDKNQK